MTKTKKICIYPARPLLPKVLLFSFEAVLWPGLKTSSSSQLSEYFGSLDYLYTTNFCLLHGRSTVAALVGFSFWDGSPSLEASDAIL